MSQTLQLLVTLIAAIVEQVLPSLAGDKTAQIVTKIITILEQVLPEVIAAGEELAVTVQNTIQALKGNDAITQEQWDALDAFEQKIDAEFDAAAKTAGV